MRARGRSKAAARRDAGTRKVEQKPPGVHGARGPRAPAEKKPQRSRASRVGRALVRRVSSVSARTVVWLAIASLFVCLSVSPVSRNLEATSRLHRMEAELDEQKSITRALEREVAEAESLEYIEREARRQRLVAPGEVLYLVTTEGSKEVEVKIKAIQSMDEAWERVREMLHSGTPRAPGGP